MQTNLHITYADGTKAEVVTSPADIVAFEAKFEIGVSRLNQDPKMTYIYFLAWHAAKRTKATSLDFEAWVETIEEVSSDPKAS